MQYKELAEAFKKRTPPEVPDGFSASVMEQIRRTAVRRDDAVVLDAMCGRILWWSAAGCALAALLLAMLLPIDFGIDVELLALTA